MDNPTGEAESFAGRRKMIELTDYTITGLDLSGEGHAVFSFDTDCCGELKYYVDFREYDGGAEVFYSDYTLETEPANITEDNDILEAHREIQDVLDGYINETLEHDEWLEEDEDF